MAEDYEILEDDIEKSCPSCGVKQVVNKMGRTAEASKLVQAKCLMCKYSKNAEMIKKVHAMMGVDRPLEDNWQPIA